MQDFPITLIGDPNHAQAQLKAVAKLKRGEQATCLHCGQPITFKGIHGWQGKDNKSLCTGTKMRHARLPGSQIA